jgi:hypothetical protein
MARLDAILSLKAATPGGAIDWADPADDGSPSGHNALTIECQLMPGELGNLRWFSIDSCRMAPVSATMIVDWRLCSLVVVLRRAYFVFFKTSDDFSEFPLAPSHDREVAISTKWKQFSSPRDFSAADSNTRFGRTQGSVPVDDRLARPRAHIDSYELRNGRGRVWTAHFSTPCDPITFKGLSSRRNRSLAAGSATLAPITALIRIPMTCGARHTRRMSSTSVV